MSDRTGPIVLAFGDSLTAGFGLAAADAFPRQLERRLRGRWPDVTVVNAGVSGDTTADGLARLPRVLDRLDSRPDLAIVELGANDLLRWVPTAAMRANLDRIVAELQRRHITVLLAGMQAPPFLGAAALAFNAVFPAVAASHDVAFYPFFLDGVAGLPGLTLADRLHPNARAIGIVADRILPHVEAALDQAWRG